MKLVFEPVTLDKKEQIERYLRPYGEGSCQHSFANMFCLEEKYRELVCEKDGWLLVYRSGRSTETENAYLMPMGDWSDTDRLRTAVEWLLEDAHAQGRRLRFETVTEKAKQALEQAMPGCFAAEEVRDYAEYLHTTEELLTLRGNKLAKRRANLRDFYARYGAQAKAEVITPEILPEVEEMQRYWLAVRQDTQGDPYLAIETGAIEKALQNYEALGLRGVVMRIDGRVCGYAIGYKVSEDTFDVMYEKGDPKIENIYRAVNYETVRLCCTDCEWVNREEDVGDPGLRNAKLMYNPKRFLTKYILREAVQE